MHNSYQPDRSGRNIRSLVCVALFAALALASTARATGISADILWLVDTSGSMYGNNKLPALQARIGQFNAAMVANGIDAHYALVTFRGSEALQQDFVDFATFTAAGSPFNTIAPLQGGGAHPELGSDAILVGLNEATFRPNAVRNFILFTDEDDQSTSDTFQAADLLLSQYDVLFNVIADPLFKHSSTGLGNVTERYGVLADAHGGQLFDLKEFLDPTTVDAFFENFTAVKVAEINTAVPDAGGTLALSLLALPALLLARRRSGPC